MRFIGGFILLLHHDTKNVMENLHFFWLGAGKMFMGIG
jgi:hypothetical protein